MPLNISSSPSDLPRSSDSERIERGFERLKEAADQTDDASVRGAVDELLSTDITRKLLAGILGNSSFLTQCLSREIVLVPSIFRDGPDVVFSKMIDELEAMSPETSGSELDIALRRAKRRVALLTALGDLSGAWPLETVTGSLSRFCGAALSVASRQMLHGLHARDILRLPDPAQPETGSGFIILGMGKLGAGELNYSSDIDLIVLFDRDTAPAADHESIQQHFIRMTRGLVKCMDERTGEGYVFRTDLRLRPDPGATPVALSTVAAETYYESLGQNWERAAMIKARPVAGDLAAGQSFLDTLGPFIWRRHLDFAAIEDIQSIKRQIHAHKGGSTVIVAGHNVKLGRGGIREVEFFAQTQQLIWGGRNPDVRIPQTVQAINALVEAERVKPEVAADMIAGYRFLRSLEHRLQMVDDQQTHSLPDTDEGLNAISEFMGFEDRGDFEQELLKHLRTIESHYAELFEDSAPLGGSGVLAFTGGEDHPDTIYTLRKMGFGEPENISDTVRGWHHGRHRATRSNRAREILTEIMPALLEALSRTSNPDVAFRRFDEFLSGLPAGVQLFSLFQSNPALLILVAEIVGGPPALRNGSDETPCCSTGFSTLTFFGKRFPMPTPCMKTCRRKWRARATCRMCSTLRGAGPTTPSFRSGVQILQNTCDIDRADLAFSDIADTAIRALLPPIEEEFVNQHGRCPGDGFAVLALGKLGGRELSATSDLDLVFLYDVPQSDHDVAVMSDGKKPLSVSHYYQRLGQRLVNALTSLTGEGRLYEVDMRLRPSGNAGPLSVSLESFSNYQRGSAWTWEHLALTRARLVSAEPGFVHRIEAAIREALTAERPVNELLESVSDMRARMARENGTENLWNVKHVRGGLVDCEFIAQFLQLRHAHETPDVLNTGTVSAFRQLAANDLLSTQTADTLIEATRIWRRVQGLLRLTLDSSAEPKSFPSRSKGCLRMRVRRPILKTWKPSFEAPRRWCTNTSGRS